MKKASATFFENKLNVFLFLLIPTVALYAQSISYGFTTLDEKWLITDNQEFLKLWRSIPDSFTTAVYNVYYRPLLRISIFLDYQVAGLSTYFYHFTNLIWHLVCVFCLFKWLTLFNISRKTAALFSLVFAIHPAMLHAVAWVPGRNDLMLCTFTLGALIFLKKYLASPQIKFLLLHLLMFACALLTKENAIVLPVLFFISAWGNMPNKKLFRLAAFWFLLGFVWLMVRNALVLDVPPPPPPLSSRLYNFFSGLMTYAGKSLFPFPQSVYPIANPVSNVIGMMAILIMAALFFKPGVSNKKTALSGLLLFFILLAPFLVHSSTRPNPDFYEHRAYTSTCGLILFFSQLRFNFRSKTTDIVFAIIITAFFIKGFLRIGFYKNEETFLLEAIKEQPGYFLFQIEYAAYLTDKGDYAKAIGYYNQAIALRPDKHPYYNDRARAYFLLGNYRQAAEDITAALKISGFDADYCLNRCMAYTAGNDIKNAMKDLYTLMQCCRQMVPEDLKNDVGLKWRTMLKEKSTRIAAEPGNAVLLYERAGMYFDTGQKKKGMPDILEAMRLDPDNAAYKKLYAENMK